MRRPPELRQNQGQGGYALVSVLLVVLVLSFMAAGVLALGRSQIRTASVREARAQAEVLADAAINRAILGLTDTRPGQRWRYDGTERTIAIGDANVAVTITDELGRIDLNTAAEPLLRRLFITVGLTPERADALTDAIRDWQDADDLVRLAGAEGNEYRAAGLDYGPRNRPFELVDEVKLVLGMDEAVFACIEPAVTIYSGRRTVDDRRAGPFVQRVLRGEGAGAQSNPAGAAAVPVIESLGGRAFRIRASAPVKSDSSLAREAIIRFTDDPRDPYWVLGWSTLLAKGPPSPEIEAGPFSSLVCAAVDS